MRPAPAAWLASAAAGWCPSPAPPAVARPRGPRGAPKAPGRAHVRGLIERDASRWNIEMLFISHDQVARQAQPAVLDLQGAVRADLHRDVDRDGLVGTGRPPPRAAGPGG